MKLLSQKMKKWNRGLPANLGNSQGLAGNVGKGKVAAFGDCNGFTAMYIKTNTGQYKKVNRFWET